MVAFVELILIWIVIGTHVDFSGVGCEVSQDYEN